jgi:predicted GNAT family acetyltransferase
VAVQVQHDSERQRFITIVDGHEAELDYRLSGTVMSITHTGVPRAIEGRGIAAELMRAALSAASDAGWTVNPVCSYAVAYLRRTSPGSA